MPDKKSIALVVVLLLMLTFTVTSNRSQQKTMGEFIETKQDVGPRQIPAWIAPSSTELKTWSSTAPESLQRAYDFIVHREKIISGADFGHGKIALLISEQSESDRNRAHALWMIHRDDKGAIKSSGLVKTINTGHDCEEVTLEKNGSMAILHYENAGCPNPITHHRYVYSSAWHNQDMFWYGALQYDHPVFISDEEPEQSKAVFRIYSDNSERNFPVELVSKSCAGRYSAKDASVDTEMIGIKIAGDLHSFAPTRVKCPPQYYFGSQDIGYPPMRPFFTFQSYDPEYFVVSLRLPNGKSVLIDARKQKLVTSKERFELTCAFHGSGSKTNSLTRITPTKTETLLADVFSDPILLKFKDERRLCLDEEFQRSKKGNPVFYLSANFEGWVSKAEGPFEFDVQSRRFQELK